MSECIREYPQRDHAEFEVLDEHVSIVREPAPKQLGDGVEKPKGPLARVADMADVAAVIEAADKVFESELDAIQHATDMLMPLLASDILPRVPTWRVGLQSSVAVLFRRRRPVPLWKIPSPSAYSGVSKQYAITDGGELWRVMQFEGRLDCDDIRRFLPHSFKPVAVTPKTAGEVLDVLLFAYTATTQLIAHRKVELNNRAVRAARVLQL